MVEAAGEPVIHNADNEESSVSTGTEWWRKRTGPRRVLTKDQ